MGVMEVEQSASSTEGADVTAGGGAKPKLIALGVGGACLAIVVLAAVVGAVIGITVAVVDGGATTATTTHGTPSSASSVVGADLAAEFAYGESAGRRLRRRLQGASDNATLSSGTEINVALIVAAGRASSETETSYSNVIPAFVQGVLAHLKSDAAYTATTAPDRAEIIEVIARTMVRIQVKHELAQCHAWFDASFAQSATMPTVAKRYAISLCKADNIEHYDGSAAIRTELQAYPSAALRAALEAAPTTRRRLWGAFGDWIDDMVDIPREKFDELIDALTPAEFMDAPLIDLSDMNMQHSGATGFGENIQNLSSTLAGSDSGFMSADTTLVGVNAISAGLTAGFAPRDNDAAGGPLFDAMDQVNAYYFVCSFLFFCLLILPSPRLL